MIATGQKEFRDYFPGHTIQFDFSDVAEIQENRESLLKQALDMQRLGYTLDEINEHLGLRMEEINGSVGNMRFVQNSLIPVDDLLIEPTPPKSVSADEEID